MDEREERDGGRGRKGKKGKKESPPPHTYTLSDDQLVISSAAAGDNQRSRYKQVGTYVPVS